MQFKILNPQYIYGGTSNYPSRDHHDNSGIPPDENDRSDWGLTGG
ncbi:hypothetical protein [uncultured Dokdonia sp.]|nr:hypothetical protein [uncultured Dokdonia sp.]